MTPQDLYTTLHTTAMISCVRVSEIEWGIARYILKEKQYKTKYE